MKKLYTTSLFAIILSVFLGCKKDPKYILTVKPSLNTLSQVQNHAASAIGIPGVSVRIFYTELDYKLNQNPKHEGVSDDKGEYTVELPDSKSPFWIRARKDTLNELRIAENNSTSSFGVFFEDMKNIYRSTKLVPLSNTPIRLELQILGRDPKDFTTAQLYLSEYNYRNNITPERIGIFYRKSLPSNSETNVISFDNLEPRIEYWIKVTNGVKTNNTTVYKTNGHLEDNPDITNVLTIGLE